jgi:hypothetical protein
MPRTVQRRRKPAGPRISSIDRLRADKRIEHVDDERSMGGYIIVTMRPGWRLDPMDPHDGVFGADDVTEAWATLRRATFHGALSLAA